MPLDVDELRKLDLPVLETTLSDRDAMFYALSIGFGRDPMDPTELPFVYEKTLQVFPTMPLIVGHPGPWMEQNPQTGVTRSMVVHGAQRLWAHAPLPLERVLATTNRITEILDKGDRGAVINLVRETRDKETGELLATGESSVFCRADGGFGGAPGPEHPFEATPDRAPDFVLDAPTLENAALWYRLNHDRNPLHADPEVAARAGFQRPILHGLCTFGIAARVASKAFGRSILAVEARFSKPVIPGETISVDLWALEDGCALRARVAAREATVLDRGRIRFS